MRQKRICMLRLVASPLCVFVDMKSAAHFVLSLSRLLVFIYRMLQIGSWKASHIQCCLWQNNSWRIVWTGNSEIWVILFRRKQEREVFTAVQCHTFMMFGVHVITDQGWNKEEAKCHLIARNQFCLVNRRLKAMKRCKLELGTKTVNVVPWLGLLSDCRLEVCN